MEIEFNHRSPKQLKLLFFGGSYLEEMRLPIEDSNGLPVMIKSGKTKGNIRYHNVKIERYIKGFGVIPKKEWMTDKGNISTNEEVIREIIFSAKGELKEFCETLLNLRELEKKKSTYVDNLDAIIYSDGCIRGQFLHHKTGTSRLASIKPNLQNIIDDVDIKKQFVSRYV